MYPVVVATSRFPYRRQRGRPVKHINERLLRSVFSRSRNISKSKLAKVLGINRNTLSKRLTEFGIRTQYSDIGDEELDDLLRAYRLEKPDAGQSYIISFLRSLRIRIPRWRVRDMINRIDGVGVTLRTRKKITRRSYSNPRPMAIWHIDGHHKAILWGIVIHGITDGYSRKVSLDISNAYIHPLPFVRSWLFVLLTPMIP